jgi:hypothetical protein
MPEGFRSMVAASLRKSSRPTADGARIDVSHEALIRCWPRLRRWLDEDRAGLRLHRHITETAEEWNRTNQDDDLLYRGARLIHAQEWRERHEVELNPLEREFLNASMALKERLEERERDQEQRELQAAKKLAAAERRRAEEQTRATRRALLFAAAAVVVALIAAYAWFAAFAARSEADRQRREALAQKAEAERQRGEAEKQQAAALAQKAEAERQRGEAEKQQAAAETARTSAQQSRNKAVAAKKDADELINFMQYDLSDTLGTVGRLDMMDAINARIRKYHEDHPPEAGHLDALREQTVSLGQQGDILRDEGKLEPALKSYRDSLAIFEKLAKEERGNAGWQRDLSVSYDKVGDVQSAQGDLAGALKSSRDSLAIFEKLAKRDPSNAGWQADLAFSYWRTGTRLARSDSQSKKDARTMVEKGRDILRELRTRSGLTRQQQQWLDSIEADLRKW